jgi:hypothetical protein
LPVRIGAHIFEAMIFFIWRRIDGLHKADRRISKIIAGYIFLKMRGKNAVAKKLPQSWRF